MINNERLELTLFKTKKGQGFFANVGIYIEPKTIKTKDNRTIEIVELKIFKISNTNNNKPNNKEVQTQIQLPEDEELPI